MQNERTALACAVDAGYVNVTRFLLENGATMDFENKVRRTDMIIMYVLKIIIIMLGLERISSLCQ